MALVKTPEEIKKIATAGKILGFVLAELKKKIQPGVTPLELDKLAQNLIEDAGAEPSFLNYQPNGATRPYPATICASINSVVVHGVPTNKPLKEGDVVSIDCGVKYQGYNADAAFTVGVGKIKKEEAELIRATQEALSRGIDRARAGKTLGDIGFAIGSYIKKKGFFVMEGLTGHGIGTELHEDPYVPNVGVRGQGLSLKIGMVLALEPMTSLGTSKILQLTDEGYATRDGSVAAHFEHTIVITEKGPKILTQ